MANNLFYYIHIIFKYNNYLLKPKKKIFIFIYFKYERPYILENRLHLMSIKENFYQVNMSCL